jgi:hypothetical protein
MQAASFISSTEFEKVVPRRLMSGFIQYSLETVTCVLQAPLDCAGTGVKGLSDHINRGAMPSQPVLNRATHKFSRISGKGKMLDPLTAALQKYRRAIREVEIRLKNSPSRLHRYKLEANKYRLIFTIKGSDRRIRVS